MTDTAPTKRGILHSAGGPLLWTLLFLGIFLGIFFLQTPSSLVIQNGTIKEVFTKYAAAVGPALAVLAMLAMYILAGIKRIVRLTNVRMVNPLIVLAVMLPLLAFGYQLMYLEKPYTDIARGIIGNFALPLLASSLIVSALAILWFIVVLVRRPATR